MKAPSMSQARVRSIAAGLLGVVAVIGLLGSAVAIWASATVFNTDRFTSVVSETLDRPEVTRSLAVYLTDEVIELVDLDTIVVETLPELMKPFAPALVGGTRALVTNGLERVLVREQTRETLTELARRTHVAMMRVLDGERGIPGVSVDGDAVSVNLLPLIGRGVELVQGAGFLTRVELPPLTADGDPAEQIAALERALARDLPDDFGQLVVFRSESVEQAGSGLARARYVLELVRVGLLSILIVTVMAAVGSVAAAHSRRRALLALGLGAAGALVVARFLIARIITSAPEVVSDLGAKVAITTAVDRLAGSLIQLFTVLAILGVLSAASAFVAGPSELAARLRGWVGSRMRVASTSENVHP